MCILSSSCNVFIVFLFILFLYESVFHQQAKHVTDNIQYIDIMSNLSLITDALSDIAPQASLIANTKILPKIAQALHHQAYIVVLMQMKQIYMTLMNCHSAIALIWQMMEF